MLLSYAQDESFWCVVQPVHAPLVITSNRDVDEWGGLFGDPLLASAAMDRVLHDAHVLVFDGDSFRNPPRRRNKSADVKDNHHTETNP